MEDEAEALGVVDFGEREVDLRFSERELVRQNGSFDFGDAADAPAEGGEGAGELAFEGAGGLVRFFHGGEELVEGGLVLAGHGCE